jgi:Matrixin
MKRLLAILLAITACEPTSIPEPLRTGVYGYELATPELRVLRWPTGKVVNVFVVDHPDGARTEVLRAALAHAVDVWNTAVLLGEVHLRETRNIDEADAILNFTGSVLPVDVSNCQPAGSGAFTTFCLTDDDEHLTVFPLVGGGASRVKFIVTVRTVIPMDTAEVRRFVAHEIGHVLGLAQHSPVSTDLMHELAALASRPTERDRATLQALYHTAPEITP